MARAAKKGTRKRASKRAPRVRRVGTYDYESVGWDNKVTGTLDFAFSKDADEEQSVSFQAWRRGNNVWLNLGCQGPFTFEEWRSEEGRKRLDEIVSERTNRGEEDYDLVSIDDYDMREQIAAVLREMEPSPEREAKISKIALDNITLTEPSRTTKSVNDDVARRLEVLLGSLEQLLPTV